MRVEPVGMVGIPGLELAMRPPARGGQWRVAGAACLLCCLGVEVVSGPRCLELQVAAE